MNALSIIILFDLECELGDLKWIFLGSSSFAFRYKWYIPFFVETYTKLCWSHISIACVWDVCTTWGTVSYIFWLHRLILFIKFIQVHRFNIADYLNNISFLYTLKTTDHIDVSTIFTCTDSWRPKEDVPPPTTNATPARRMRRRNIPPEGSCCPPWCSLTRLSFL